MKPVKLTKTKSFDGKIYKLMSGKLKTKALATFFASAWRAKGRELKVVEIDGGYAVYMHGR